MVIESLVTAGVCAIAPKILGTLALALGRCLQLSLHVLSAPGGLEVRLYGNDPREDRMQTGSRGVITPYCFRR